MANNENESEEVIREEGLEQTFIPDREPGMSTRRKNEQLSVELATGDTADLNICSIKRDESEDMPGWKIYSR